MYEDFNENRPYYKASVFFCGKSLCDVITLIWIFINKIQNRTCVRANDMIL